MPMTLFVRSSPRAVAIAVLTGAVGLFALPAAGQDLTLPARGFTPRVTRDCHSLGRDHVMVGISGASDFTYIFLTCIQVNNDGKWVGATKSISEIVVHGGLLMRTTFDVQCSRNEAVTGMGGTIADGRRVTSIVLTCRPLASGGHIASLGPIHVVPRAGTAVGNPVSEYNCVQGRSGRTFALGNEVNTSLHPSFWDNIFDAFRLTCDYPQVSAPPPTLPSSSSGPIVPVPWSLQGPACLSTRAPSSDPTRPACAGDPVTCKVWLSGTPPRGGSLSVQLTSDPSGLTPASTIIGAEQLVSSPFSFTMPNRNVTVDATVVRPLTVATGPPDRLDRKQDRTPAPAFQTISRRTTMVVQPAETVINRCSISPNPASASSTVTVAVVIAGFACYERRVTLSILTGGDAVESIPTRVLIPYGGRGASFQLRTRRVANVAERRVTIRALLDGAHNSYECPQLTVTMQ